MRPIPFDETIILAVRGREKVLAVLNDRLDAVPARGPQAKSKAAWFKVINRGLGRVALESVGGFLSVNVNGDRSRVMLKAGKPTDAETFQWTENPYGDLVLMSLVTHRHLRLVPDRDEINADHPGPLPDRRDGSCFTWRTADEPARAEASTTAPTD